MKRYLLALLAALLVLLGALAAYNYRHDALGIVNTDFSVRRYGVAQRFVKMRYILDNPERYDAFCFGSSRVAKIPVGELDGEGACWYNFTYGAGLPNEWREDIEMLLAHGVKIRHLIIGLDDMSFRMDPALNETGGGTNFAYRPHDVERYLRTLFRRPDKPLPTDFAARESILFDIYGKGYTSYPWVDEAIDADPAAHRADPAFQRLTVYRGSAHMDDALDELRAIRDIADAHGIELTVIINPIYAWTYLANDQASLAAFQRRLASITGYYDFSGVNDITADEMNYYESSHFRPQVGRRILARIAGGAPEGPQGFGALVTAADVDAHLAQQAAVRDAFLAAHPGELERRLRQTAFVAGLPNAFQGTPDGMLGVHLDRINEKAPAKDIEIAWPEEQPFGCSGWQAAEGGTAAVCTNEDTGEIWAMYAKNTASAGAAASLGLPEDAKIGFELHTVGGTLPSGRWALTLRTRTPGGALLASPVLAHILVP